MRDNRLDCGITLASPSAASRQLTGSSSPFGVFDNTIANNELTRQRLSGRRARARGRHLYPRPRHQDLWQRRNRQQLDRNGRPGRRHAQPCAEDQQASHDNVITGNYIAGNGRRYRCRRPRVRPASASLGTAAGHRHLDHAQRDRAAKFGRHRDQQRSGGWCVRPSATISVAKHIGVDNLGSRPGRCDRELVGLRERPGRRGWHYGVGLERHHDAVPDPARPIGRDQLIGEPARLTV